MNRYLLFAYQEYYPQGGWSDFQGSYQSLSHAIPYAEDLLEGLDDGSWEVVDKLSGGIIARGVFGKRFEPATANFKPSELGCPCCPTTNGIDDLFLQRLQQLRTAYGKPMVLNSAYRCRKHNTKVGGVEHSYHTKGMAVDVASTDPELRQLARQHGLYVIEYPTFTHIDGRPRT